MKPSFHHRLINKQFDDPCLYVRMMRESRAFLFDAGFLGNLKPGDIQKITNVFVTHMHIDHFIGFDTLLRALLRRENPLYVYGPYSIIECIEGKLKGYTWNLIKEYPLKIEVFGISNAEVRHASFYAQDNFNRIDRAIRAFDDTVLEEPPLTVKTATLSHGIECLGFSLEEDFHINIDKASLSSMGLHVGPWLSEFKTMLRQNVDAETKLNVGGRTLRLGELLHIALITRGQKISYITDISPEDNNIRKAIDLVKGSDTLYCEAYFLHEDIERAFERHHLTARIAGEIAKKADVKNLAVMHFSPKYRGIQDVIEKEAMDVFLK